ncbi:cytotoxic and regulatory T-cell molecule isoform X2 [Mastacembelus armatus]|uniref:cytotoxic and regulatory T-cell molecule isoform X2 n=1 Tax=Mastacembelus armatus TaxID=205130 RepID=UPI000E456B5F|nr:cytotoxic and regulatory T-cell molecule-like isoform X2 [Mastacembelus armatus]
MELKLQLSIFILLIQASLALWQRVSVIKGQTLQLTCPIKNAHKTIVEWKNPKGYIMFFKHKRALQDKRYSIHKLSESKFTIRISNVTFKDGGNYTCSQYDHHTIEKKVEVTVLGLPKMSKGMEKGNVFIKCTAEGNHYPPQISWKLDHGPEIVGLAQVSHEDNKYMSVDILSLKSVEARHTVKCLVRHPSVSQPLTNFVNIGKNSQSHPTTMASSPTAQPQRSTGGLRTTAGWFRHGRTTVYFPTRDMNRPSSQSPIKPSSGSSSEPKTFTAPSSLNPVTSTGSHVSTIYETKTSVISTLTRVRNNTISNETSTTESVSGTTVETNSTEGNITVRINDQNMQTGSGRNSSLLVLLVTCLIFGLLVVVIFFAIKLRRAHIAWKKVFIVTENEDSNPSEESSKSKSSLEERNSQGQKRRGVSNTAFTQYVAEEPVAIPSVINTAAVTVAETGKKDQISQHQAQAQTATKHAIKETAL